MLFDMNKFLFVKPVILNLFQAYLFVFAIHARHLQSLVPTHTKCTLIMNLSSSIQFYNRILDILKILDVTICIKFQNGGVKI